ncbi:MAG: isoamylase early set domain-containing protein [Gemmatimonadales bacterium]
MPDDNDPVIERIAQELRRPVHVDPAVDARIMALVETLPVPRRGLGAVWRWLRRPHTVTLTPLRGLALAAGLAALAVLLRAGGSERTTAFVAPAAAARALVQFVIVAPAARSVVVVGDFNDWDPAATPLRAAAPAGRGEAADVWSVALPLPPGRYRYAFIVDGTRWLADPSAPRAAGDDFGTPNSVVTVGA